MEKRYFKINDIQTRDESGDDIYLEGMFVMYGDTYQVWDGATESIAPGAFSESIHQDVRALYNHNDDLVLGRTSAGTLELEDRSSGLWGRIKINRKDTDAMNAYERIKRGDITGCSFGFNIAKQETDYREDGTVHWTITEVNPLYEISPCTFPAYEATHINARKKDLETMRQRKFEVRKHNMLMKLKGGANGSESTDASEEN